MINFVEELMTYLAANTSLTVGTDLFNGYMPDSKINIVSLSDTNSPEYTYNMSKKFGYTEYYTTVIIRGSENIQTTRVLAKEVQDALENLNGLTLGSYRLIRGKFETPMNQLDARDDNNNFIYVGNYRAIIE